MANTVNINKTFEMRKIFTFQYTIAIFNYVCTCSCTLDQMNVD